MIHIKVLYNSFSDTISFALVNKRVVPKNNTIDLSNPPN